MDMMKKLSDLSSERISQRVFYVLIGVAVVVFGLFYLVGYEMPFDDNPDFNAPLFTDAVIGLMCLLLVAAVGMGIYAMLRDYKLSARQESMVNGVPARKIFRLTWLSTLVVLVLSFVLASSAPMLVNGDNYADWLWLKVSDMFVVTSIVLLVAAIGAVIFGATRYIRKGK